MAKLQDDQEYDAAGQWEVLKHNIEGYREFADARYEAAKRAHLDAERERGLKELEKFLEVLEKMEQEDVEEPLEETKPASSTSCPPPPLPAQEARATRAAGRTDADGPVRAGQSPCGCRSADCDAMLSAAAQRSAEAGEVQKTLLEAMRDVVVESQEEAVEKAPSASPGDPPMKLISVRTFEVEYPEGVLLAAPAEPKYTVVEVVLDSGAGLHVISRKMITGNDVEESELSRMGAGFVAANGDRLDNYGQVMLSILTPDASGAEHEIRSKFEVTDVTRPLWSVGLICDSGLLVNFSKESATVSSKEGKVLCYFQRVNGLYIAKVKIKNPKHPDFRRPGK